VLGNSRRPLVVCDQCNRTDPAIAVYSARTNSESQQPLRSAASPTGSGFAGFRLFSRIIPLGYQSSGQSSTECFSCPAQAAASRSAPPPLSREPGAISITVMPRCQCERGHRGTPRLRQPLRSLRIRSVECRYSITSSARSGVGMLMPSVFAVLRLTTKADDERRRS
jgi:hypothetical protein